MPNKQQNTIQEEAIRRYEAMPSELKQAMSSIASAETIYGIGKKFGLNIEDTGNLANVIGYTILGMIPTEKFIYSVKDVTGVDNEKAASIAREVSEKIFLAIREKLKEAHGDKWNEREITKMPTEIPTRETPTKPITDNKQPITPTAPKSPWEIRPDGFDHSKQVAEMRSVIPPTKPESGIMKKELGETMKTTEAEMKKAQPPEPPKTREAPQPAPASRSQEVLKEIRPAGQPITNNQPLDPARGEQPTTAPKAAPPTGLPFMKEVSKLTGTPELGGGSTPMQPQIQTPTQQEQTAAQPKPPQAPPTPQTQTQPKQPPTPPSPAPMQKNNADPYREPIE